MTNPNNAIGTNGAYGGRTSVNAFNDDLAIYQGRGILSGFAVSPNAGMSVAIGGDGATRDVAIAEDNIGNKTTINNISESPVVLNIAGAPASNSRIDAIVAYVDNPAQGVSTETDNPSACGLIDVQGAVSASPSRPDENVIRTAITADGASGATAYYVVLGYVRVSTGMTDITNDNMAQGDKAYVKNNSIRQWNQSSSLGSTVVVEQTSPYGYRPVPGLKVTLNGPVGAVYMVLLTASVSAPANSQERYLRLYQNNGVTSGAVITNPSNLGVYTFEMSCHSIITQTTNADEMQAYVGGDVNGGYTVWGRATISAIRIA